MLNPWELDNVSDDFSDASLADYIDMKTPSKDLFTKAYALDCWKQYLRERNRYFFRRTVLGTSSHRSLVRCHDGVVRRMIMLSSNSYFELNNHPEVKSAAARAIAKYGTGSASAPLLAGTLDIHRELEKRLAEFKFCESAMVFSSGFQTNYSLINGLVRSQDAVINDILNHASIVEGCRGVQAKFGTYVDFYAHNNMRSLERKLDLADKKCSGGKVVVSDGVFSMDGDIARLPEICQLAKKHQAKVVIDEAHATGVLGKNGYGTCEHYGLKGEVDLIVGTFSKTFGAVGGFIAGKRAVIDYLRVYAPGYMFSTAMAPADAAAVVKSLEIIRQDGSLRESLWANTNYMHAELTRLGFDINGSETPIIPVRIPHEKAWEITNDLQNRNIFVTPVIFPAVGKNRARLRISLMSSHTREDLDQTLEALVEIGHKYGII